MRAPPSLASVDALGGRASVIYDPAGRTVGQINPLGYRGATVYDKASQTVARIDRLNNR